MPKRKLLVPALILGVTSLGCQAISNLVGTPTPLPIPTAELIPTEVSLEPDPTEVVSDTPQEYEVPDEGRSHIELGTSDTYDHYPPSSGLHYGTILQWGFYNEEVPPEL